MEIKSSKKHTLFNPGFIDDYGFTPEEFRVFARIMRRTVGGEKDCYESIPNLSKSLMISEILVRRALKVLQRCNAITRTERPGKSDLFDFNGSELWLPREELAGIRAEIEAEFKTKDRARKVSKNSGVVMETQPLTPDGNDRGVVMETTGVVVMETTDEGIKDKSLISNEGNPVKVIAPTASETPLSRNEENAARLPVQSFSDTDERLRFFPFLEKTNLPVKTLNELTELFSDIASQQNRRTLIKENEWVEQCKKFFDEVMSVQGIGSLYRYCKDVCKKEVVTPKVLDWKLTEYKAFLEKITV